MTSLCRIVLCCTALSASVRCGLLAVESNDRDIERLVRQLGSDDFRAREEATKLLKESGKPALKALRIAATRGDAETRRRAALIVAAIENLLPGQKELDRALAQQCWNGNATEAAKLLEQGASPTAVRDGRPVLNMAAASGDLKIMQLLLECGADVNAEDAGGYTALREAAGRADVRGVKLLLDARARPDPCAFGLACWLGHMEAVKLLLDAGVSPDAGLPRAAHGGRTVIVRLLLARGANVNTRCPDGDTALHLAAQQGGFKTVRVLLEAGADANATSENGWTPLHQAVCGSVELRTVKLLAHFGAKLNVADKQGRTPLHLAAFYGDRAKAAHDWLAAHGGQAPTRRD